MKEQTLSSPEGQTRGCLQTSEMLSWGRGTEFAVWPQGVKPSPTSGSHYRENAGRNDRSLSAEATWEGVLRR